MSIFVCPNCGSSHSLFGRDGAQKLSSELDIELLGTKLEGICNKEKFVFWDAQDLEDVKFQISKP